MINKEDFVKLVEARSSCHKFLSKAYDLGIDLFESSIDYDIDTLFDLYASIYLTEEGKQIIFDFIFEDEEKMFIYLGDNYEKILEINNAEELYDFMLNNKTTFFND